MTATFDFNNLTYEHLLIGTSPFPLKYSQFVQLYEVLSDNTIFGVEISKDQGDGDPSGLTPIPTPGCLLSPVSSPRRLCQNFLSEFEAMDNIC